MLCFWTAIIVFNFNLSSRFDIWKSQSSNILAVYDWFEVVCSDEVSRQVSGGLGTSKSEHVDLTAVTRGVWSFNNFWNKRSRCSSVFENQHWWWSQGALSKSLNAKSLHISEHDCFWLRWSPISSIILWSVLTHSWEVCFALPWGTLPRGQIPEYSTMATCCRDRYCSGRCSNQLTRFFYTNSKKYSNDGLSQHL
jgi:hypothetical protein